MIYEKGAHAIIYGERGVGKSSLANVIRDKVPSVVKNLKFIKDNCRPEDSFFDLWAKMLFDFEYEGSAISELLQSETRHFIVQKMLETLDRSKQYIFIFDEFDRIADASTKNAMADTIKHFSDYPQNITIVIVGVGEERGKELSLTLAKNNCFSSFISRNYSRKIGQFLMPFFYKFHRYQFYQLIVGSQQNNL